MSLRRTQSAHRTDSNRAVRPTVIKTAWLLALSIGLGPAGATEAQLQVQDSTRARFTGVTLTETDQRLSLYGEVRSPTRSANHVPGKVQVDLLDSDGHLIASQVTGYRHAGRHARYSWFQVDLEAAPDGVATVSVSHHSPFDPN